MIPNFVERNTTMTERLGQQFGRYRLSHFLGGGNFGEVYLGEHIHRNNTLAAVKVLQARLTAENLKEFINEASTMFRLQHPHIVRLLDFGIGPAYTPFLAMAYAPNGTLRQRHSKGTRLPLDRIIAYVRPIAAALQYAHDERLIHRDVKPENILLGPNNEVWLSDFGITSVAHDTPSLKTGEPGGTVPYMAPEQLRGKPRLASDQYALGVIVYEWLCGEWPFGGTVNEIAMQHFIAPPPSLREKVPAVSPDVEQVVLTALAKDPAARFASVQAFAMALQAAACVQPPLDPRSALDAPARVPPPGKQVPTIEPSAEIAASSPAPLWAERTSPATHLPTDGRAAAQAPLPVAQRKKPLPSIPITPGFLPVRVRLPGGRAIILALLVLVVVGSGVIWAVLYLMHQPSLTYDQFVMKNGIQFGFDAQHSRFNPYESQLSPATVATLVQAWTSSSGSAIDSSPTVANGMVYVGSDDHRLHAFNANGCGQPTCQPLWTASTGFWIYSSPAVAKGVVYVGSRDGKLYAFNASTGALLWTYSTGGQIFSSPAVANGVVYVGSYDNKLYAFKAGGCGRPACSPLWTASTGAGIFSSPAVANGVVYVGSLDGKLYAFNAAGCGGKSTCMPLWTATTGAGIDSSPAVADGVVYVGSYDNKLYAFKADGCKRLTCSPLWTASTGSQIVASSPAVANGIVYVGSSDGKLYAFKISDCGSGSCSALWTASTRNVVASSPAVANGVVYVGSRDGKLYAFKADGCGQLDCLPLWIAPTGGQITSSPAVANGVVYVGSYDGKLYAFHRR